MTARLSGRVTADIEGDYVLFIIGMQVHRWRRVGQWGAAARAMVAMLHELRAHPELGLLRAEPGLFFGGLGVIEYWRSYEDLEAYARAHDHSHLPAWRAYNRLARTSDAVGIYHETYRVTTGNAEQVYHHMSDVGGLAAHGAQPLTRASTSARRIGDSNDDIAPVDAP